MVPSKKEFIASDLAAPMKWFVRVKTLGSPPSTLTAMRFPSLYSFIVVPEVVTTTCVQVEVSKPPASRERGVEPSTTFHLIRAVSSTHESRILSLSAPFPNSKIAPPSVKEAYLM